MSHFNGKSPLEHLIEARRKGHLASAEIHGTELPGHYSAAADAAKETTIGLLLLWILFQETHLSIGYTYFILLLFTCGFAIWKVGRSALLGYSRIERLHRLIEEERWEIEHHREQEREELKALYQAKGFSGKLLDEVVSILMADDNRLLQVMLEEELGLNLESYEHPLKQASGAFFGVIGTALTLSLGFFFFPLIGIFLIGALIIALASGSSAQLQKNRPLPSIIWDLGVAFLALLVTYFLMQAINWCAFCETLHIR